MPVQPHPVAHPYAARTSDAEHRHWVAEAAAEKKAMAQAAAEEGPVPHNTYRQFQREHPGETRPSLTTMDRGSLATVSHQTVPQGPHAVFARAAHELQTPLGDAKEAAILHRTADAYAKVTTTQAMVEAVREGSNPFDGANLEHARIHLAAQELGALLKAQGVGGVKESTLITATESAVAATKARTPTSMLGGARG